MHAYNTEYNPNRNAALVMKIKEPNATALIFSNGKVICTGVKTEVEARTASYKFAKIIQKLGYKNVKLRNFEIHNTMASCDVQFSISLSGFFKKHMMFSSYEPELFPGLKYYMKRPKVVFSIFISGKIVMSGAKTRNDIYNAFEKLYPAIVEFKKPSPEILGNQSLMTSGNVISVASSILHDQNSYLISDHNFHSYTCSTSDMNSAQDMSCIMAHLKKKGVFTREFDLHDREMLNGFECDGEGKDELLLPVDLPNLFHQNVGD